MAVTFEAVSTRRATLLAAGASLGLTLLAAAQQAATAPFDSRRFVAFAVSSAEFQRRAASVASLRDTRPEVKAFAAGMTRFREEQLERLRAASDSTGIPVPPPGLEPEHRVVLENLEPLDYLALSRRYMEVQLQALEQEARGYEIAVREGQGATRNLAEETLPEIRRWRDEARRVLAAVSP
jgi:predicted outer membrane protein